MEGNAEYSGTIGRLVSWITGAAITVVTLLGGVLTLRRFHDFDVLWHVTTGEWILDHGSIPFEDPFGAVTAGVAWIDVAWAAQIVMALLSRVGGLTLLHLVAVGIVGATLLALLACNRHVPVVIVSALAFVLVVWFRFLVRPDLLTFPVTVILLFLVHRLPARPRSTLWWLAGLTVMWANVHGSFVLAPITLLAAGVGALVTPATRPRWPLYAGAAVLTLGASLVNPYGAGIYGLFLPYVRSALAIAGSVSPEERLAIAEWKPTWQVLTEPPYSPFWLLVLVLLVVLSCLRRGRGVSIPVVFSVAALGVLGVLAIRNLLPFAAALLAFVAINERDRQRETWGKRGSAIARALDSIAGRLAVTGVVVLVGGVALVSVLTDRFYVRRDLPYRTGVGIDLALVPEGAVRWLAAHDPSGKPFNNFDSGAYLLYRLHPRYRPYDDARVVDAEHFRRTRRAVADPVIFDRTVNRDALGTVVLVHPSPESLTLLPRLARDPRWRLAFRDHNSTVHVRAALPTPTVMADPPSLPDAEARGARVINEAFARLKLAELPASDLTDAFVSSVLGDEEREKEAYRRAREIAPDNPRVRAYFGE